MNGPSDYWWHLEKRNCCVTMPAKCGSQAVRSMVLRIMDLQKPLHLQDDPERLHKFLQKEKRYGTLRQMGRYSNTEIQSRFPDTPKYLGLRHPVSRFASLWRDKCPTNKRTSTPLVHGLTPVGLLDYIKEYPERDQHWATQCSYVIPGAILIDYARLLIELNLPPRKVVNATVRSQTDPAMPEDAILEFYAADFVLWQQMKQEDNHYG